MAPKIGSQTRMAIAFQPVSTWSSHRLRLSSGLGLQRFAPGGEDGSGLTLDDGVVCDASCQAAPGVVAAGDVARWPNPRFDGASMRLEHWTNAAEQGL